MDYVVCFVTAKDKNEAQRIAERLLKEKLAACVNIVEKCRSLFWWEGKISSEDEALMVIKSKKSLVPSVITKVKELHSYTVPEVIAFPIIEGNPDYLKWIDDSTQ